MEDFAIGVMGTMKTGKSTLLNCYGFNSEPHEQNHTLDIKPHYFDDVNAFHFVDFPGKDDINEVTAAAFSSLYNSCDAFIFVLELEKKDSETIVNMVKTVNKLGRPVLLCLNKADIVACTVKVCMVVSWLCSELFTHAVAVQDGVKKQAGALASEFGGREAKVERKYKSRAEMSRARDDAILAMFGQKPEEVEVELTAFNSDKLTGAQCDALDIRRAGWVLKNWVFPKLRDEHVMSDDAMARLLDVLQG